jgi:NAD(P)-dependent dehydrogenase (short-subunit alcohol dehydrogenase family)
MKIAVITGGNRGVGKSTAINVAKRGVGVILTYNSHPEEAERVVSEIDKNGGKAIALKLDVSKTSSLGDFAALAEQVLENSP